MGNQSIPDDTIKDLDSTKPLTQYNYTLDTLRVAATFMVVLIHQMSIYYENGFDGFWNFFLYRLLFDISVPIFFAAMGYFIFTKEFGTESKKKLSTISLKRSARYFKYYILASAVYVGIEYFVVQIDKAYLNYNSMEIFMSRFTLDRFINGTIGGVHLWFLMGAVLSFILFAILFRFGVHPAAMILIAGPLYYVGHIQPLANLQYVDQLIADEGLFMGMFYMTIGMFVRALTIKYNPSYLLIAIGTLLIFPFAQYFKFGPPPFIFLTASTMFFIIYARSKGSIGKNSKFIHHFSKYSLFIYLFHLGFLRLSNKALQSYNHTNGITNPFWSEAWYFPVVFTLAIVGPILLFYILYGPILVYKKQAKKKNIDLHATV
ncbi:hypothetical protein ABID52_000558 [Fictibacillus halophilus]|uniref:Acyltransferase 3 domain-containing protein n=1 Tax=Fictibacillus halophilus TaxID=1610490 RepID=A0ABV2LHL3_9BACL|nr:acyltransferase [Fictibacillus halophilus]